MQSSSKKLNKTIQRQISKMLNQVLADAKNEEEVKVLLQDLLTDSERLAMSKRLAIALYLDKGRSYENIKKNLHVSSATIAGVAEQMGNPGMQMAINKIKAEQWAEEWSKKFVKVIEKVLPKSK